jgi:pimeloyl-ACP methyl ester carboxylesterase
LLTYDLPGFGESDPHPNRNLKSSAMDMLLLANAVGINDKFWVVGYSSGSMHAWAALRYIPYRVAGIMSVIISIRNLFESALLG